MVGYISGLKQTASGILRQFTGECMPRKLHHLPPAIPNQEPLLERRFFEINERVTVFDELHARLKKHCNHYVRGPLEGQLSMDGGVWIG